MAESETMAESELHRIRQVAAAMHQMDGESAQRLLAHFPEQIQSKISKEIDRIRSEAVQGEARGSSSVVEPVFPLDAGGYATVGTRMGSHAGQSVPYSLEEDVEDFHWLEVYTSEQLASSLAMLRPMVAAMILKQLPLETGTRIVQSLPVSYARKCLKSVQGLHAANPEAASIVLLQWRSELSNQIGREAIEREEDKKVRELLKALGDPDSHSVAGANRISASSGTGEFSGDPESMRGKHGESSGSMSILGGAVVSGRVGESRAAVIPMESPVGTSGVSVAAISSSPDVNSQANGARPFVIPIDRKPTRGELVHDLLQLHDVDLLRVLYQHEPRVVLSFLAGAGKQMRHRIEQLTAPKLLPKLRRELVSHRQPSDEEWRGIAAQINQTMSKIQTVETSKHALDSRVSA